jgi:SulP family sulfate permease
MVSGATVALMGLLQIAFRLLKQGKFIRMAPFPAMMGFVNGLAVVIFNWRSWDTSKRPGRMVCLSG